MLALKNVSISCIHHADFLDFRTKTKFMDLVVEIVVIRLAVCTVCGNMEIARDLEVFTNNIELE